MLKINCWSIDESAEFPFLVSLKDLESLQVENKKTFVDSADYYYKTEIIN
jgi:hypothetical protein